MSASNPPEQSGYEIHYADYWSEGSNEKFSRFFKSIFKELEKEILRLQSGIYSYSPLEVFTMNEATWVGILSHCIQSAFPESQCLLEAGIYNDKGSKGRADLLVWWDGFMIYVEGKGVLESVKGIRSDKSESYYDSTISQLKGYVDADKDYFVLNRKLKHSYLKKANKVFLVPIYFGSLASKEIVDAAKASIDGSQPKRTNFCWLFSQTLNDEEKGVWVYGMVERWNSER